MFESMEAHLRPQTIFLNNSFQRIIIRGNDLFKKYFRGTIWAFVSQSQSKGKTLKNRQIHFYQLSEAGHQEITQWTILAVKHTNQLKLQYNISIWNKRFYKCMLNI